MGMWSENSQKVDMDGVLQNLRIPNETGNVYFAVGDGPRKSLDSVFSMSSRFNVIGINANEVPNMQNAIRTYIDEVKQTVAKLDALDPTIAFKGEYANAVREYVEAVKYACSAVTSQLLAFNDQLTAIQNAYAVNDAQLRGNVSSWAQGTRETFTEYAEGSKQ